MRAPDIKLAVACGHPVSAAGSAGREDSWPAGFKAKMLRIPRHQVRMLDTRRVSLKRLSPANQEQKKAKASADKSLPKASYLACWAE